MTNTAAISWFYVLHAVAQSCCLGYQSEFVLGPHESTKPPKRFIGKNITRFRKQQLDYMHPPIQLTPHKRPAHLHGPGPEIYSARVPIPQTLYCWGRFFLPHLRMNANFCSLFFVASLMARSLCSAVSGRGSPLPAAGWAVGRGTLMGGTLTGRWGVGGLGVGGLGGELGPAAAGPPMGKPRW